MGYNIRTNSVEERNNPMATSNKKFYLFIVFIILLLFGVTLITTNKLFVSNNPIFGVTNDTNQLSLSADDENYFKYFRMFRQAYDILKKEFYNKSMVTAKKLLYGAISGLMSSTGDPYTTFMEPDVTQDFFIQVNSKFGGLGIHIDIRDGWLTVVAPMEDTPAWRAGLKPNDKIIEIEGKSTVGMSTMEAVNILRGEPGTKVTITIQREGIDQPFKVTLVREEISLKTVKSSVITNGNKRFAFIKIGEFSATTAQELSESLKKVLPQNPDGVIIDLRNNPGGLLSVVVECVDMFLDKGLIVYTRGRDAENNSDFYAKPGETLVPMNMPLVVLVNQGSASASEIFSGAMKDTHRGVLVGMKTFGKGSVQKTFTFPEDGSMIKYTVAQYFTPSGVCIDKVGLEPDVEQKIWYETLSDQEQKAMVAVQNTNFISQFLTAHPNFTDADLGQFRRDLGAAGYSMDIHSLEWLVQQKKHESEMPDLYDFRFDEQLQKAIDVMQNYSRYRREIVSYDSAR